MATRDVTLLHWAAASRARRPGEASGDDCLVRPWRGGVLVAAIDALGHGPEAAQAALAARATLETEPDESLQHLLQRCHARLRGTRGVVLSLAVFDETRATMTWIGIGNIRGVLARARPHPGGRDGALLLRPGIVGRTLPRIEPHALAVEPGDRLILATDGIAPDFGHHPLPQEPPQHQADRILERYVRGDDDALVVVAVYQGSAP
jgi:negative regulator of sigma-B (phosphoserine phosphatase)